MESTAFQRRRKELRFKRELLFIIVNGSKEERIALAKILKQALVQCDGKEGVTYDQSAVH